MVILLKIKINFFNIKKTDVGEDMENFNPVHY